MQGFPKYPEIENLYKCTDILQYKCVITEKIHGTNVRVMWSPKNGGLILGGRNEIIFKDGMSSNHDGYGFGSFMEKHPSLEFFHNNVGYNNGEYDDYVFYGEYHGQGIQKGVKYCDEKDLRIFDVRNPEGNLLDWDDVEKICKVVGFKTVPVIAVVMVDLNYLNSIRDNVSTVAKENGVEAENNTWEGVVLKPVHMQRDKHGEWMMAKYKSEKWAENVKAKKPKSVDPDKIELQSKAREFAESVVTSGRISNIVEHITRDGNTELDMKRTPEFLRELVNDVMKEHSDIYASLDKNQQNAYNKAVSSLGLVPWKKCVEEYYLKR